MTEKDWNTFFALLSKVLHGQSEDWRENRQAMFDAAAKYEEDAEVNLETFAGWIEAE